MKMGLSVAMLLFTGVSTIGVASGAGYRIAAVCAAVLCGIGGIVFAFYNERKVLNRLAQADACKRRAVHHAGIKGA